MQIAMQTPVSAGEAVQGFAWLKDHAGWGWAVAAVFAIGAAYLGYKWWRCHQGSALFFQNRADLNKRRGGIAAEATQMRRAWIVWPAGGAAPIIPNEALKNVERLILRHPLRNLDGIADFVRRFDAQSPANLTNAVLTLTERVARAGAEVRWHDNPCASVIINDHLSNAGWARIEVLLPDTQVANRPSVFITKKSHPRLFEALVDMFERQWIESSPSQEALKAKDATIELRKEQLARLPAAAAKPHDHQEIDARADAWKFVPASVYLRFHPNASKINLAGLDAADPYVAFSFGIANASGKLVVIKSIDGEMSMNGDAAWGHPKLERSPFEMPPGTGYENWQISFKQTFSETVKQKMLDCLKDGSKPVAFDFGSIRFIGTVNGQEFDLPVSTIGRYVLKGPIDRTTTEDQDNVWMLERMFASQLRYELWSGNPTKL